MILITHDLGVVAEMAQRVVVMYAGRKVEEAPVRALFNRPLHPYTRGLLGSMPHLRNSQKHHAKARLTEIPGMVPSLKENVPGCLFAPRCSYATEQCRREAPPLEAHGPHHLVACWESSRLPAYEPDHVVGERRLSAANAMTASTATSASVDRTPSKQ